MKNYVWFNGKLIEENKAKVNMFDYGFLYGDGLFETMRAYRGHIFGLKEHLDRLSYSINLVKFQYKLNSKKLGKAIYALLEINKLKDAYVRLNMWRAEGKRGLLPQSCKKVNIAIIAKRLNTSKKFFNRGVKAIILKARIPEKSYTSGIKSFNYLNNLLAKFEIESKNADEGIFLNHNGFITEATTSNIFFVKNEKLYTPSLDCGILPGITRKIILKIAKDNNIDVIEGKFKISILSSSQEVFLTNSIIEILPVKKVDNLFKTRQIPGKFTEKFSICYKNLVKKYE